MQVNNINIDEETLQKYVRPYQNGLGVDYMKLWQRIEHVQASSSTNILAFVTSFLNSYQLSKKTVQTVITFCRRTLQMLHSAK